MKSVCTEILRRLDKTVVKLCHDGINRQNHIWQEIINHSQYDRTRGVDHVEGSDIYFCEYVVDNARILKQSHPCVGSEKKVHPHGNHDEHYHCALSSELHSRKNVCQRIGNQKANNRCNNTEPQGTQKRACVIGQACNIVKSKCSRLVGKGIIKNHYKRNNDEYRRPDNMRSGAKTLS